jgi:hypothetical protein
MTRVSTVAGILFAAAASGAQAQLIVTTQKLSAALANELVGGGNLDEDCARAALAKP